MGGHRDAGRLQDPRKGERQRFRKKEPRPPVLEAPPHGGLLKRGANYGNRGGRRPPNAIRIRLRGLTSDLLDELERRIDAAARPRLIRAKLLRMTKERLADLLLEMDSGLKLSLTELRQLLDTTAKYGLGTNVHSDDGDGGPVASGIIILPAFASDPGGGTCSCH
jgi:hypothetical protein